MDLPLDMRATLLVASLDVIAEELDAVRRGRPVSTTLEAVIAEAHGSARILADELHPAQAVAVGETHRPSTRSTVTVPARSLGDNVVQLNAWRS